MDKQFPVIPSDPERSQSVDNSTHSDDRNHINNSIPPRMKTPVSKYFLSPKCCIIVFAILAALSVIGIIFNFRIVHDAISSGADAAQKTYTDVKAEKAAKIYDQFFNAAESQFHIENEVSINIASVKEEALLQVLDVYSHIYDIYEKDDHGVTSWLLVQGKGTFSINLNLSEFIVDTDRLSVLIRVPKPELTTHEIIKDKIERLYWKDEWANESIQYGEELARKQLSSADAKLIDEFLNNQNYIIHAKDSAETLLINLVKSFNPDYPDLRVEVEFMD